MNPSPTGIDRNLTHYADPSFSRYLRRAFLASAGYDKADLAQPVVGIADISPTTQRDGGASSRFGAAFNPDGRGASPRPRGARAVGFRTAFIPRPLEWGPEGQADTAQDGDFDIIAQDFHDLAAQLGDLIAVRSESSENKHSLCGYFDSGTYLGYEAAEGIDWVWEHRIGDLEEFGL